MQPGAPRLHHCTEEQSRRRAVSPHQFQLLLAVRGHPSHQAVTMGEVADQLLIDRSSATLLVDRAVRGGLHIRVPATVPLDRVWALSQMWSG